MSSPAATPSTPLPVQPGGGRRRAWARQRPRVLFYGEGIGLGDRIINVKMANRLMLEIPGASALLMTPAPAELRHRLAPGVDVCELPRIALQTSIGAFEPLSSGADLAGLSRARGEATRRAAEHFNPDLMVVNHSPTGIGKELLPTFKMLRGLAHRPKLVLSLRDILSEPAGVMIASWRSRGEFEAIATYYDRVLVHGSEAIVATADRYGFADAAAGKVRYCGYVAADRPLPDRSRARAQLNVPAESKLIVVTGGGGVDAFPMMSRCLSALHALEAPEVRTILLTGPAMSGEDRDTLRRMPRKPATEVWTETEDPLALFCAADLIISMAGYSTMAEALSLHQKMLVLPRVWETAGAGRQERTSARLGQPTRSQPPVSEQRLRSELFAQRGLVDVLDADATIELIAHTIRQRLDKLTRPGTTVPLDGLERAVDELRSLLPSGRSAFPAALVGAHDDD